MWNSLQKCYIYAKQTFWDRNKTTERIFKLESEHWYLEKDREREIGSGRGKEGERERRRSARGRGRGRRSRDR